MDQAISYYEEKQIVLNSAFECMLEEEGRKDGSDYRIKIQGNHAIKQAGLSGYL